MKRVLESFIIIFALLTIVYSYFGRVCANERRITGTTKAIAALTKEQEQRRQELLDKKDLNQREQQELDGLNGQAGKGTTNVNMFNGTVGNASAVMTPTKSLIATIVNVMRIVGTGVAIIMLTYVAIKYMSAAPSEKAEFKKSAVAYIVGAIVLFASMNILKIIADFATTNI